MTPKDKAKELWSKYRPIIAGKQFVTGFVLMSEANELTKQCALIAVDEILNLGLHDVGDYRNDQATIDDFSTVTWYINYWQEVKHEITQL
jgi:hypothetical protein